MKLIIEVEFTHELTERGQQEVKAAVQEFRETMESRSGRVTKAELIPGKA